MQDICIHAYLQRYLEKYKDQKAFSYWKSNHVDPIYFSQNNMTSAFSRGASRPAPGMGSCKEELCVAGELAQQAQLQVAIT